MVARLAALSFLAFMLVCAYALYLQPGWESWRDDQPVRPPRGTAAS
jgi:hypothetical protein